MPTEPHLGPIALSPQQAQRVCCDMPIALSAVDGDGRFLWANAYFQRVVERTEGELLQVRWQDITYEPDLKTDEQLASQARDGSITSYTMVKAYRLKGDEPRHRRLAYGTLTVWRHPVSGPFEYFLVFFVPFNDANKSSAMNAREILALVKENWKWMLLAVSTLIGLVTGTASLTIEGQRVITESTAQERQQDMPGESSSPP